MAESKSKWFALFIKAHSEKMRKFDLNPIKSLAVISECRHACRTSRHHAAVLAQISTRLRKAGDFRGRVVPSRLWWRFSPPLFRSSPSAFVAAPRWNLSLLPCDIR
jgi:hypothetical protein